MFKSLLKSLFSIFDPDTLPDLSTYEIPERPRRNVSVESKGRSTKGTVYNGAEYIHNEEPDGTIETKKVNTIPETSSEVVLDEYDVGFLDFVVGKKWVKDQTRAKVLKWHWLKGQSAEAIEKAHTSKEGKLEFGYSERTVTTYITAFYDADDDREKHKLPRQRPPRATETKEPEPIKPAENVVEW